MSTLKTVTSAMTAAVLVTGIGLAFAQTEDQRQPADPMVAATASPTSEQTPADPNALPPTDSAAQQQQQPQQPPADPAQATPPVDSTTAPLPSAQDATPPATTPSTTPAMPADQPTPPAPRADRN